MMIRRDHFPPAFPFIIRRRRLLLLRRTCGQHLNGIPGNIDFSIDDISTIARGVVEGLEMHLDGSKNQLSAPDKS